MDKEDKTLYTGGFDAGDVHLSQLSQSLHKILIAELSKTEDIYNNLLPKYDESVYEDLEKRFIDLRNKFKSMSMDISDSHYIYINESESKKAMVAQIISHATSIAKSFQEAQENKRLNRPVLHDTIENLIVSIKSLIFLCEGDIHGDPTTKPTPPKPSKKDKNVH